MYFYSVFLSTNESEVELMILQNFIPQSSKRDIAKSFLENLKTEKNISYTGSQSSGKQHFMFPFWNQISGYYPTTLIEYLMKGRQNTVISGVQGCGKTTLMLSLIENIHPSYTIQTKDKNCDYLRSLYPSRNVLPFINREPLLTNGHSQRNATVSVFDYEDTDSPSEFIQQYLENNFIIFTHSGNNMVKIIKSLSNSILERYPITQESSAEQHVVNLIDFNIHIVRSKGACYIQRITECIPLEEPKNSQFYEARNIIELINGEYITIHPISKRRQKVIEDRLTVEDKEEFRAFNKIHWG